MIYRSNGSGVLNLKGDFSGNIIFWISLLEGSGYSDNISSKS